MKNIFYNIILTALLIGGGLACGKTNQQTEVNKLIGETNQLIREADKLANKTEFRNKRLFDADVQTIDELEAYKIKMKQEASEIIENYIKTSQMLTDISKKFENAADLNVRDIFKEYAVTKSEEFAKRAEAFDVRKGNAQAFIEISSPKTMNDRFDENNSLFEKLIREADEFADQAKSMETENSDVFNELNTPDAP